MDINERIDELITRTFGPTARLGGTIGTTQAPGRLDIIVGGVQCGSGRTLAEAVRRASVALSVVARWR